MNIIRHKFFESLAKDTDDSNSDEYVNLLLKVGLPIDSNNNIMSEIIDIVGLNAKSEWERFASKKIADKWIKDCDIPILVIREDHQRDLKSKNFKDIFNAWKNYPLNRKFLIATFTYDNFRIQEMLDDKQIKGNPQIAYESVLEYLKKQITEQTLAKEDLMLEEISLYPVTVICKDEDYFNASEIAIERLEHDIRILEKKGPKLFRLKQAFLYKHTVSETISNKQNQYEESIHLKEQCISNIKHKIKNCMEDIEVYRNKINELQNRYLDILEDINTKIHFKKPEIEVDEFSIFSFKFRDMIRSRFYITIDISIPRKCRSVLNEIDDKARIIKKQFKVNLNINKNINLACLRNAEKDFDQIMKPHTFPWILTKKKRELVKQNFYDWIDEKQKLSSREIQKKFKKDNDSLIEREVNKFKKKIDKTENLKVIFNKNLRKERAELKEMILKYKKMKKEFRNSEKIVNQYDESICIAYIEERKKRLKKVRKDFESNDIHSMIKNIAYLYQLTEEAKYLRSGE